MASSSKSRRVMTDEEKALDKKPKPANHWSRGLVASMDDPDSIVEQDDDVTVIRDAYPKAKFHFLVLPKENIAGVFKLNRSHLSLLRHMEDMARSVTVKLKGNFKIGYHSIPSMQRLHLHVISDDMDSPCLKTKVHWNSFTTDFFIPSEDLIAMVSRDDCVRRISDAQHKAFMVTPLKCHKCDFVPKNMPTLKTHLQTHL